MFSYALFLRCVYKHRQVCSYRFAQHTNTGAPGDGLAKCCPLLCSNMAAYRGPKHVITNSDMLLAVGDHMFWPPVSSHVRAQKRRNLARPSSPGAPAFVCGQTCRNTPGLVDQHLMFLGGLFTKHA